MATFKTIVVAVDFSDTSDAAWSLACDIAHVDGGHLHLLHVSPEPFQQPWAVEAMAVDFEGLAREWRKEAEAKLSRVAPTRPIAPGRITRTVVPGIAHSRIMEHADEHGADLIVMGTHGYGPLKHLMLGSVAERVIRYGSCPVLTVPHRAFRGRQAARQGAATATRA